MDKKQDSVTFVKERAEEGEDWETMRRVQINRAFYNSKQWISWDRVQRRVYVPELRPGEKRYTYNKIKPAVNTLLAKLCKNRVKLETRPDSNDVQRIEVAKAALKYLHYQWQHDQMDRKTRRLKGHMIIDGFPALMVYVDRNKGNDIAMPEEMDIELDSLPTKSGEIVTVVIDQLSLKVDPTAEDITEIRWAIREYPEHIDVIADEWGVEVTPDDNLAMRNGQDFGLSLDSTKKFKDMALVRDYWERPCPKYPSGRRIVVAGDKELYSSDDPGEFPFIFFPAVFVPGRAVGDAIVSDLTTPQKSYNIKRTAEARILEEMGNPLWLVPTNSVPDMNDLTDGIGGVVEYTPISNSKPERAQGAVVTGDWQAAMERDEADMEDISGAHEISQGGSPKGNNTLGGLQLQVEQDETKLALLVQSYEDGIKEWGEKVLRLIKKHFPEEQQLSIVGENGEIEAFTFAGADLEDMEILVDVVAGSSMPTLKAVQDEKVFAMWGAGMFNDPQTGMPDTRKVVRMLGESIATGYFNDREQDENKALMENRLFQMAFEQAPQEMMMYLGQMQEYQLGAQQLAMAGYDPAQAGLMQPQPPVKLPIVRDFYDHAAHIEVHNRFRKSDEYDNLPPEFQAMIDQHVAEHEQALMAPIIAQQQQQMQMQQEQAAQQAEADEKSHEREQAAKMQDHYNTMEREGMKANVALQQAAMKGIPQ